MKKLISAITAAFCIIVSSSCSDSLSEIGASTRPYTDGITISVDTFNVPIQTVFRDSVYIRTGYPLLGSLNDPYYGKLEASYLAQFYANEETSMNIHTTSNNQDSLLFDILKTSLVQELEKQEPGQWAPLSMYTSNFDSLVNNTIDSMTIRIYYESYYGDSLAPMQLSIYSLNSNVDFDALSESEFYSNNTFQQMYSKKNVLGRKSFTAANRELNESDRNASDYMDYIEVKLSDEYKDQFLRYAVHAALALDGKVAKEAPNYPKHVNIFTDQSALRSSWLSGVCVKPTFGDGVVINVYYTAIYFFYSSFHRYADDKGTLLRNSADDGDSTYVTKHVKYIAVTPDVTQLTGLNFIDEHKGERLAEKDTAYITSPLGYYSTIDLPVGKIINRMMSDPLRNDSSYFLKDATFYLKAYKPTYSTLAKNTAPTLLMVQLDSINTFFEEGTMPNRRTSCYASFTCDSIPKDNYLDPNAGLYYYGFGNINSVILGLAENAGWHKEKTQTTDQWVEILKSKGKLSADQTLDDFYVRMALLPVDATTSSSYGTLLSIANYIHPTAVCLQKGSNKQSIQMIYSLEGSTR